MAMVIKIRACGFTLNYEQSFLKRSVNMYTVGFTPAEKRRRRIHNLLYMFALRFSLIAGICNFEMST